jgi:uncharacterized repeat protein (TIGR01451 family)
MSQRVSALLAFLAITGAAPGVAQAPTRPDATSATRLTLTVDENKTAVRRGAEITFAVTVTNNSESEPDVTVCDRLPASVATVVLPRGVQLFDANACITYDHLRAGRTTFRLVGRIGDRARLGFDRDRATVFGTGSRVDSAVRYRVLPMQPVNHGAIHCA